MAKCHLSTCDVDATHSSFRAFLAFVPLYSDACVCVCFMSCPKTHVFRSEHAPDCKHICFSAIFSRCIYNKRSRQQHVYATAWTGRIVPTAVNNVAEF